MSALIKGFKTFLFLVLLIIVTWQYALEIYGKFINGSKTFVSKTVDADSFIIPPLTICMDNALKVRPCLYKKKYHHTSLSDLPSLFINLFVTSKNEFSNSPIHEFKVLHKSQRAF